MAAKPAPILSPLVSQLYDLDAEIEALKARRKLIAGELIGKGEGTYSDDSGRTAVVVCPSKYSTKYNLYKPSALADFLASVEAKKPTPALQKQFRELMESQAQELAGDHFKALFDRQVLYVPTAGFEQLVPKLITTQAGQPAAAAAKLLVHCQIVTPPKDPYVRLPDKPKSPDAPEAEED